MVVTIICEVITITYDIGSINVRFFLLQVLYPQKRYGYYKFTHKLRLILILQWNTRESWHNLGANVCPSKCEPYLYFRFRQLTLVCTCHMFYWSRSSRTPLRFFYFFIFFHILNFIILVTVMPHFCTSIAILVVSLFHL